MTTIHSIENLLKNSSRKFENNSCTGSASDSEQSEMNCPHEIYPGTNVNTNLGSNPQEQNPINNSDTKQNLTQEWLFTFENAAYCCIEQHNN